MPSTLSIEVRYFAGARAAAGLAEEIITCTEGDTVETVMATATAHRPRLAGVLPKCSYLLDGIAARPMTPIAANTTLDVLPPFAGG